MLLLETAKHLEKDLEFELASLLGRRPCLRKLEAGWWILEEEEPRYIIYSVIIKRIFRVLAIGTSPEEVLAKVKPAESFYLEAGKQSRELAAYWEQLHGVRGSVHAPRAHYLLYNYNNTYYLCIYLREAARRQCLLRAPKYRPFSRSGVLNSELARLMVNFARVLPGSRVLDPFCGAGSLLLEAWYNNARELVGIDIDSRMLEGCRQNLSWAGAAAQLIRGDCREVLRRLPKNYFDAVVTDPPYGLSTKLTDSLEQLLKTAFSLCWEVLRPGGRLVFVVPSTFDHEKVLESGFKILYVSKFYVHKSLTRKVVVAEKCSS
ncbi:MAG: methyltransferase domain-containing protein [bacterium]|nr:methyltransferase domain-containing protein [bacterium]